MDFKDKIVNECLALLSKEEVKDKIKDEDVSWQSLDVVGLVVVVEDVSVHSPHDFLQERPTWLDHWH